MGKLINGKVRFNAKPQPFMEMSDKFYFLGQGYTKYSLSPIKNDFSRMSCDSSVFANNANLPIASSIVNMNYYTQSIDTRISNVLCCDEMIITDSSDPNIEYILTNPLEGVTKVVRYNRKDYSYTVSSGQTCTIRKASIIGQSDRFVYFVVLYNGYTRICSLNKDTLVTDVVFVCTNQSTSNYYHNFRKVYEDNDVIIIGEVSTASTSTGVNNMAPTLIILNKNTNSVTAHFATNFKNDNGNINMNSGGTNQLSGCSNVSRKGDSIVGYFLGVRALDEIAHSTLIKFEYNIKTLSLSKDEFTKKDGFDIGNLNFRFIPNRSHCHLELSSNGDIDTINIFDCFTDIKIRESYPLSKIKSGITTFNVNTFSRKVEKIGYSDISENDFIYHIMKMSENTLAAITSNSVVYCTKDNIDGIYRPMNIEPLESPSFVMKDADQNIWCLSMDGSVYKLNGPKRRIDMYCKFEKGSYEYKDREINTNVIVGIKDYITGKMVKGNVILKLSDNCVFRDNDTNTIKVTTSDVIELKLPVTIKASGALTTQIDVNFDTEE